MEKKTKDIIKCMLCKRTGVYYELFDCYVCNHCNIWLEDRCKDTECKFCGNRPNKPNFMVVGVNPYYQDYNEIKVISINECCDLLYEVNRCISLNIIISNNYNKKLIKINEDIAILINKYKEIKE